MCLNSRQCLLPVCSRDNESLNVGWVQAGTHPSWYICTAACCVSLQYRCDLWTKPAVCFVISWPKLMFLIASHCVYFNMFFVFVFFAFLKKHIVRSSMISNRAQSITKGFNIFAPQCRCLLSVYSGKWTVSDWSLVSTGGERFGPAFLW